MRGLWTRIQFQLPDRLIKEHLSFEGKKVVDPRGPFPPLIKDGGSAVRSGERPADDGGRRSSGGTATGSRVHPAGEGRQRRRIGRPTASAAAFFGLPVRLSAEEKGCGRGVPRTDLLRLRGKEKRQDIYLVTLAKLGV